MPLTPEEIDHAGAALVERGADNRCQACTLQGTMNFVGELAQVPIGSGPLSQADSRLACAILVCDNCGHVRMHAVRVALGDVIQGPL
jgi:hypothetical protein